MTFDHLVHIDEADWPGVATVPAIRGTSFRRAQKGFEQFCERNEVHIKVHYDALYARIADAGWLGLAEGYMAGEWHCEDLAGALSRLLAGGFRPKRMFRSPRGAFGPPGGSLPASLVRLYAGDGLSPFGGIFASGVATTVRNERGIDITTIDEPAHVEREDLGDAQTRGVDMLLDAAGVSRGTYLVDYPASGGALSVRAAQRGATVDTWVLDEGALQDLEEFIAGKPVEHSLHIRELPGHILPPEMCRRTYEAAVSIGRIETIGKQLRGDYLRSIDQLLLPGGIAAIGLVARVGEVSPVMREATDVLRAYIWPALDFPTMDEMHRIIDRGTSLCVSEEVHSGKHSRIAYGFQRAVFEGRMREAAAAGYDPVYRRLWDYHLALMEALFRLGILDSVQLTLRRR
ncbi:SAM-dependent methyltransferase [Corynebacterium freiburgense]|uniref:SAM-dependent methyltransferase n=1 Tax=Corynebacterium freiburgense TaxID=556548 RepID=UPI00042616A4|nr:class I SAM-dependent methyltransferase [Corynebacterium freiburgense]WJZ02593.1 cyclopropane fatty acyl phospholipid synthase [Corynebacterium freiburgense]